MALIEVCVQLCIESGSHPPEVRLWVDPLPDEGLNTEIELPLRQRGERQWTGAFSLREDGPRSFLYRLGVVAHAGASWALSFRDRGADRELLTDSDLLGGNKAWFTGNCTLLSGEVRRVAQSRARVVRANPGREKPGKASGLLRLLRDR